MTASLIRLQAVHAGYGMSKVLFDIEFDVMQGSVVTLLGRNGMGKTTTVRSIIGAVRPVAGGGWFDGVALHDKPEDEIARMGIAIVPEGRRIFPNLTVWEHLVAFARPAVGAKRFQSWTLERLYELFPRLAERSANKGYQLSGGEQQMLAIARALSTNPRLLILDEATEGLAPVIRDEIWDCIARLREAGQTILLVDKHVDRLLPLADMHVVLERGQVVWIGDSVQLAADPDLASRYLTF